MLSTSAARRLDSLQAGRAIAATAVVVYHTALSATALTQDALAWARYAELGAHGVDFFFVLSGFIIFRANDGIDRGNDFFQRFLIKRATRIYVPYLPVALALACAYTIFPTVSLGQRQWTWLSTITLLPGTSALNVAWTLQYEIAFYILMGAFFANRTVMRWCFLLLIASLTGGGEFITGVAFAWAVRRKWLPAPVFPVHRNLVALGDASYAIYLVHLPVLAVTSRIAVEAGCGWIATTLIGIITSLMAGVTYHRWCEIPALKAVGRVRFKRRHLPSP